MKKKSFIIMIKKTIVFFCGLFILTLSNTIDGQNENTKRLEGKISSLSIGQMPKKMSDIFYDQHHERIYFDSCAVLNYNNGEYMAVAYGKYIGENRLFLSMPYEITDTLIVKYAFLVEKEGDRYKVRDTPPTTCTCTTNCTLGCDPELLPTGKWICTECTEVGEHIIPRCNKSVTANPLPKE